jgi:hypothetical protein
MANLYTKSQMKSFFFEDPKGSPIERKIGDLCLRYFYFSSDLVIVTKKDEILNGCLLSGNGVLFYDGLSYNLDKFDMFFLPPDSEAEIKIRPLDEDLCKLSLLYTKIKNNLTANFELQHHQIDKFIARGDFSSSDRMATRRTVWTGILNGYYMSGFTSIPKESLVQGVVTSVNLDDMGRGIIEIHSHVHPNYPEVYIYCIDDDVYAVTQYLINEKGESICLDLVDGEGVFFPGSLGHMNFAKPTYKTLKYCSYMWMISTGGRALKIDPITLDV